ncbi:MAG TPA: HPr family phosphocarrier protein [Deferrisomatales bacterium]|nr:HPr family phosphocarrier protein [Deferrisomatales bacterium]
MSEASVVQERTYEIVNTLGLHARAAAQLVQLSQRFQAEVEVRKDELAVNGKSIMGVLMLAAAKGTQIVVRTSGADAVAAMEEIGELIRNGFWEEG